AREFGVEVEGVEQQGGGAAQRDEVASDSFQIFSDLFDPFEGVLKGLAIAATEAHEGRHDLDPVRSAFVPKVKTLAPVRWFDQTDPRAPRIHRKPLSSYIYPTRRGTFNRRMGTMRAACPVVPPEARCL